MKYFSFLFLLFVSTQGMGQAGLVAHFTFDKCGEIIDVTGVNNAAFPQGFANGIGCACGVRDSALVLGGAYTVGTTNYEDQIFLVGNYDNYFDDSDFTVSLYFKSTNLSGNRTLFAKLDSCTSQTGISLRYTAATSFVSAFVGENSSKKIEIFGKVNNQRCWHHVVLVKKGKRVRLYADGELLADKATISAMNVRNDAEFILGSGPCVGVTDFPFEGHIDELRVYNRALPFSEIQDIAYKTDLIGNKKDTLIVEGSYVDIYTTSTCATSFAWSPSDPSFGVDDPLVPNARITPPESGTYFLTMAHPEGCSATDSIHITVVNPDSLDCEVIYLPKAFTPNGDGLNDSYGISNPYAIVDFVSFEIFDRWGGRVFYTENAYDQWDGSFNNKKINPGVCVYRVVYNCKGEEKIKLGSLTILR